MSPWKFTPRGRGHHFVAIKRRVSRKSYRIIGFQWIVLLTKWWGRVHQPPLFITSPFCTEVYFIFSWVWILLACLDLVPQKRHHFVRTGFSTISLRFFSIVIKEQPILFVRKWAQWYVRPVFLQCWRKVKRSYPCFFFLGGELCWKARLTGTSGMAVNFEILIDLSSCNSAACLHQGPSMQAKFMLGQGEDRTSGISIPSLMQRPAWCTRPYHFVWIFLVAPTHFVGFLQGPTSYSYKVWALTCWGDFTGDTSICIDIHLEIYLYNLYIHINFYFFT